MEASADGPNKCCEVEENTVKGGEEEDGEEQKDAGATDKLRESQASQSRAKQTRISIDFAPTTATEQTRISIDFAPTTATGTVVPTEGTYDIDESKKDLAEELTATAVDNVTQEEEMEEHLTTSLDTVPKEEEEEKEMLMTTSVEDVPNEEEEEDKTDIKCSIDVQSQTLMEDMEDPGAARGDHLDELMDMGTVDQEEQEAQMKDEEENMSDSENSGQTMMGRALEKETGLSLMGNNIQVVKVAMDDHRLQAAARPPRLSPNGDPASPSQVTVKDEPIDEEYNQALISSSAPTDDIKDEPETPKEQDPGPSEINRDLQEQADDHDEEQSATQTEGIRPEHPLDGPYQPSPREIEPQTLLNRTLKFQDSWYQAFPWLHYSQQVKGVLCFHCMTAFAKQKSTLAKCAEQTFISAGFRNWKKSREAFSRHQNCKAHAIALNTQPHIPHSIRIQLCSPLARAQEAARLALLQIVGAVRYLSKQGLALRGHSKKDGNFQSYLRDKAEDDPNLASWLEREQSYTSPDSQNEILSIMGNIIIGGIAAEISALPVLQYSLIMDGTQYVSGTEQISICLRYVDQDLEPREEFVGLYEASSTTGEHLWRIASDVLLRLNLPLSGLRGLTYDGAANLSGNLSRMRALVRSEQPLASFVHCGPQCVNLVIQATCSSTPVVSDALQWIHDLGCLFGQSGKFKTIFKQIAISENGSLTTIKPLCDTRWTVRTPAIKSVLTQYEVVLVALEEMASAKEEVLAPRASGLLDQLQKGNAVLGLLLGQDILLKLEGLNKSLHGRAVTIGAMLQAVDCTKKAFVAQRTSETFMRLYSRAVEFTTSLDLQPINLPHVRKPSNRYDGPANSPTSSSAEEYFRLQFFSAIDTASMQLDERFNQESLGNLAMLEQQLLSGEMSEVVELYPELDAQLLPVQLAMLKANNKFNTGQEVSNILKTMVPEVRRLFPHVEALVRLLLVVPVSSCKAEQSFSALRRLKTLLRSTMSQSRLNSVSVCHVHREKLEKITREEIATAFIGTSERRAHLFGTF